MYSRGVLLCFAVFAFPLASIAARVQHDGADSVEERGIFAFISYKMSQPTGLYNFASPDLCITCLISVLNV